MTTKYASSSNIASKSYPPGKEYGYPNGTPNPYVRPSDWLELPIVTETDQIFAGLVAVTNSFTNYLSVKCTTSAGTYSVNWGDGTIETFASNVQANHTYDYAAISNSTITSNGYKQVVVTVTPSSGNLTGVLLQVQHPLQNADYRTPWLDVIVAGSFITQLTICSYGATGPVILEQVRIVKTSNNVSTWVGLLNNCYRLQKVVFDTTPTNFTLQYMFSGCSGLRFAPEFPTVAPNAVVNMIGAFGNCRSLEYVPDYNFLYSSLYATFSSCLNLVRAPKIKLTNSGGNPPDLSSGFSGCSALRYVPDIDMSATVLPNTGSTSALFNGCNKLVQAPYIDTMRINNTNNMFAGCVLLQIVPTYNTVNVTSMEGMFINCTSIKSIPNLNTSKVTNFNAMFQSCVALASIPQFDFTKATLITNIFNTCETLDFTNYIMDMPLVLNLTGMFAGCKKMKKSPVLLNVGSCTNHTQLFFNCFMLQEITLFDTSNSTNISNMFANTYMLETIPNFNFQNVTTFSGAFNGSGITTIPAINTNKMTLGNQMFENCRNLISVPYFNTSLATNVSSMFNGSGILVIPNLNYSGATSTAGTIGGSKILSAINVLGIRYAVIISNNNLGKYDLENVFANLGAPVSTTQTITISNNPGSDALVTKTGSVTLNSRTIAMANTTGVAAGQFVTASYFGSVTMSVNIDSIFSSNYDMANGAMVGLATQPIAGSFPLNTPLYVINSSGGIPCTFQVSTVPGGSAYFGAGSAGSCTVRRTAKILSVVPSTSITVDTGSSSNGNNVSIGVRILDTRQAVVKNWTVTG